MPNWMTHLEIAKRANKKYNYKGKNLELFFIGNILPDINNGFIVTDVSNIISHNVTHFTTNDIYSYKNFKEKYKLNMNNPLIMGYYTHLLTDFTWNNDFYSSVESDKKLHNLKKEELKKIKQSDFKVYDNKYMNDSINIHDISNVVENSKDIEEISIDNNDIMKVINYINNHKNYDEQLKFYCEKELDQLIDNTLCKLENE